jgi:outer membrane protein OmpA-like peptidoglycan-associated protein
MIAHGVDKKRLKSVGYGESKLINKCGNNVQCTEEEHAKNRRTEFKIVDTGKK